MPTSTKYLLLGAVFGAFFPLISTPIALYYRSMPADWAHIVMVQQTEPLLWVIDTAPLFLGLFAFVAGIFHQRLEEVSKANATDLEHLFRISRDILCVCTTDGKLLRCNLTFERMMSEDGKDLSGQTLPGLVHEDDQELMRSTLATAGSATTETNFENRVRTANGDIRQIQWNLSMPVDGKFLAIGRDVTVRRLDQEKMARYAESLERSLSELDQFAYVVSHDLKAPLRGIHSLADFIEEDLDGGEGQDVTEHLTLLKKRASRMQNLIMGVLAYTRAGKDLEVRTEIPMEQFLEECVEALGVPDSFHVELGKDLPTVRFNPSKLQQVVQNLIANSVKYTDKAEGRIRIECRAIPGFWEISIADNGPGIPERFHQQVFSMFRTLQPRDEVESTGIGLPIVKKIVEEAGGSVSIDPDYSEGTRVVFTIERAE